MLLNLMDTLNKWGEQLRVWLAEAFKNPFFLLLFFGAGILIFKLVYDALNKTK